MKSVKYYLTECSGFIINFGFLFGIGTLVYKFTENCYIAIGTVSVLRICFDIREYERTYDSILQNKARHNEIIKSKCEQDSLVRRLKYHFNKWEILKYKDFKNDVIETINASEVAWIITKESILNFINTNNDNEIKEKYWEIIKQLNWTKLLKNEDYVSETN